MDAVIKINPKATLEVDENGQPKHWVKQSDIMAVTHGLQHLAIDLNKGYGVKDMEALRLMVNTMMLFMEGLKPKGVS